MSADDYFTCEGTVVADHRGCFSVDAIIGGVTRRVLARSAGRVRVDRVRVVPGDVVELAVSAYDPTKARITYRGRRTPREGAA